MDSRREREETNTATASSSSNPPISSRISQYNADARLLAEFDHSKDAGNIFNYIELVKSSPIPVPEVQISAYLSKIQRGGLIQPFGCLLAIEEPSFRTLAYSENSFDMLEIQLEVKSLLGIDARSFFTYSSGDALTKAASSPDISLSNPVLVHLKNTQQPFYAILHRIDVGVVIDLEPVQSGEPSFTVAGAVQAISRLQSLPGANISALCDAVVEEVQQLVGYDRVMVYKFHEDDHGEVIAEIRRSDLEPYLGLHYPATDIPQATRFLFMQNRVRMICNCHADSVRIIQYQELSQPLLLVNSTLRSSHACHKHYMASMGSVASLVMAILLVTNDSTKLWGLVACHHSSPRYIPFPIRCACEFLMQAFGLQLNIELQLASHMAEKKIMKTLALLCDLLLSDIPFGIVTRSPNIMDLVNCDGAAFYYGGKCQVLGVTPSELQIKEIADWLLAYNKESIVTSTESLVDIGYPGATILKNVICGMAAARITSKDFLFWFRSSVTKEVRWGGARHHPNDKDDGGRMHPRSSFRAFIEVVKNRSLPWEITDINAIHSLQLILRGSFRDSEDVHATSMIFSKENDSEMEKLFLVANEMIRLIETASVPIFGVDMAGLVNRWNAKIAELTGLPSTEAIGKSLANELVHEASRGIVEHCLSQALQGKEGENIELKMITSQQKHHNGHVFIVAKACTSKNHAEVVVGVCFVGQDITEEKIVMDKFLRLQGDYKAIVHSLNPLIPPIFASDENAYCSEWNPAMEKLTGWTRDEVIGKMLPGEIFGSFCKLKDQDVATKFMILLYHTLCSQGTEKFPFSFFDRKGTYVEVLLTVNKRTDMNGNITGCFCFLQTVPDLQHVLEIHTTNGKRKFSRLQSLAYIRQEMISPLSGIRLSHKLLESTSVSDEQRQLLEVSESCERQMMSIIEATGYDSIEDGCVKLNMEWFLLKNLLDAIVSQVMILLRTKKLQLIHEVAEEIKTLHLYGDQTKLQQVLSDFLLHIVCHAPSPDGWVEVSVTHGSKQKEAETELSKLQFRMAHPGLGLPSELVEDMFEEGTQWVSQEGHGLSSSRKLLSMMNGSVQYIRENNKSYFLIDIGLQTNRK